jgi:hypothetical protein
MLEAPGTHISHERFVRISDIHQEPDVTTYTEEFPLLLLRGDYTSFGAPEHKSLRALNLCGNEHLAGVPASHTVRAQSERGRAHNRPRG